MEIFNTTPDRWLMVTKPPKWHDAGPKDTFLEWFRERIDEMASISRRLRRESR